MEMDLVYRRAHYFATAFGENFEDLVQEGVVACLEAELDYDPSRGTKMSTWLWWSIERRMRVYCERSRRVYFTDKLPDLPDCDAIEFIQFIESVPSDVRCACKAILEDPERYIGMRPSESRRLLKEDLQMKGWSVDRAHEAIQDAKYHFSNTSPDMQRTA